MVAGGQRLNPQGFRGAHGDAEGRLDLIQLPISLAAFVLVGGSAQCTGDLIGLFLEHELVVEAETWRASHFGRNLLIVKGITGGRPAGTAKVTATESVGMASGVC